MSEVVLLIFPLNNFDSNVELLRLADKARLRRSSSSEFQKLRKTFPSYHGALELALKDVNYVLETKIRLDDIGGAWEKSPYMRDIVLALRLLKAGDVNVSFAYLLDSKDKVFGCSMPSISKVFFENPYFLKKEEIASFKKLWKKVKKVENDKPYLKFPLVQFTKAFEERASGSPSDSIVDCMIALESLVFYGEDKSIEPAGKVIGIAIGMLLGNNEEERNEIKKTLIKAYEIRNAKVHGNLKKTREIPARCRAGFH